MRVAEQRGLSMVEALLTLVIAGVITSAALPQLQEQVRRSRRADAWAALAVLEVAQERHRAQHGAYADSLAPLAAWGVLSHSGSGHYELELIGVRAQAYTAVAWPRPGSPQQSDADCARLALVRDGVLLLHLAAAVDGELEPDLSRRCWPR